MDPATRLPMLSHVGVRDGQPPLHPAVRGDHAWSSRGLFCDPQQGGDMAISSGKNRVLS